jgi:hypothetical protein
MKQILTYDTMDGSPMFSNAFISEAWTNTLLVRIFCSIGN